jgi:TPR repeat protein
MDMSRAFTSEEYEVQDLPPVKIEKTEVSADHDLVLRYSAGRKLTDASLPYEIGMHFLKGDEGFFQSDEFAVKWLKKAAEMDDVAAMTALAELYLRDSRRYGYRDAAHLLKKASDSGSAVAAAHLDMRSAEDPATKKAFTVYRLNAELGDADACLALAEGFEKEYYGKEKWKAAALWYRRAFEKGRPEAAKRILNLYNKKKIELTEKELKFLRS